MASPIARNESSKKLLEKLNIWASFHEIRNDPYLNAIIESLETGSNHSFLAKSNIGELLPTPTAKGVSRFIRTARTLSILRNVLIFAPVAITWLAVAQATAAFDRYLKENAALPVNFLQFWQDGYGYLDSQWRISEVALVDFLIILFVAFLSVTIGISQQIGVNRTERFLKAEASRRTQLVFELTMYFDKFQSQSVNTMTEELKNSSALLVKANAQALESIASLRGGVEELLGAVAQTSQVLQGATKSLKSYYSSLDSQAELQARKVASLVQSIEMLEKTLAVIPSVAINESKQVTLMIDKLSRVVNGELKQIVSSASKTLSSTNKEISASSSVIKSSTRSTKTQLESLQKQLARAEKSLRKKN
jgi:hypothetical protein